MAKSAFHAWEKLVTEVPLAELGPQRRAGAWTEAGLGQRLDPLLTQFGPDARRMELIRALLLLWHDHLEAAHELAQGIPTPDGSFVHAIMHRREPDFANAKYWWRKTGGHAAFPELARRVATYLRAEGAGELAGRLMPAGAWDAFALVDCVASVSGDRRQTGWLQHVQQIETLVLLEHFLAAAR